MDGSLALLPLRFGLAKVTDPTESSVDAVLVERAPHEFNYRVRTERHAGNGGPN